MIKVALIWIVCVATVCDSLGRYLIYYLVVFLDSSGTICLFMWDFSSLDQHESRVTVKRAT